LQEQIITGEANNKVAGGKPIWNKSALAASGAARQIIIVFAGEREREKSTHCMVQICCWRCGAQWRDERLNFIGLILILLKP